MNAEEARRRIAVHAGKTERFTEGYRYALRYGFCTLADIQEKFDDLLTCLQRLMEAACLDADRLLLAELHEILWAGIVYVNTRESYRRAVGVFTEVLSETLVYLLEDEADPFAAFAHYRENYDDILRDMG